MFEVASSSPEVGESSASSSPEVGGSSTSTLPGVSDVSSSIGVIGGGGGGGVNVLSMYCNFSI